MLFIGLGAYLGSKKSAGWAVAGALIGTVVAGTIGEAIAQKLQQQEGYGYSPLTAKKYGIIY